MADPIPQSVRVNDNLLSAWEEYVAPIHAHKVFKTWAGISLISAALTRRVWFRSTPAMPPIIPNLFVLSCAVHRAVVKTMLLQQSVTCWLLQPQVWNSSRV